MNIGVIALLAVIVIASIAAILWRRSSRPPSGFKEIYETREGKENLFTMMQPRTDLHRLSERQIDKLVQEYVESAGQSAAFWQVCHLEKRAVPSLLKILANSANQVRPAGKNVSMFSKSKVERALEILRRYDCPETVPYLNELASHDDYHLRYSTAVSAAHYPSSSTLGVISALMADPEEHVRGGVYIGLSHAIREKRLTPELRRSIIGLLSENVVKESEAIACFAMHPAALLLDLDVNAGTKILATPEVLNASSPGSARVIDILSSKGVPIPESILNSLLDVTDSVDLDYRLADLRGELLKAMAGMGHPEAESLVLQALARAPSDSDPDKTKALMALKELAAEALCIVMAVRDPIDLLFDRLDEATKAGKSLDGSYSKQHLSRQNWTPKSPTVDSNSISSTVPATAHRWQKWPCRRSGLRSTLKSHVSPSPFLVRQDRLRIARPDSANVKPWRRNNRNDLTVSTRNGSRLIQSYD